MKNNELNINAEARTMSSILADLNEVVSEFNALDGTAYKIRLDLDKKIKDLLDEYNEFSLLQAYALCKDDEMPMKKLAESYFYLTAGVKDTRHSEVINGKKVAVDTRVLDTTKERMLNIDKFVQWMHEAGIDACAAPDWAKRATAARDELISQWKSFINSGTNFKVAALKKALQKMVDGMVFTEGQKGENAFVVTSKMTRSVIAFCTARKDGLKGQIAQRNAWEKIQLDVLHAAVTRKEFTVTYGDEDTTANATPAQESTTAAK